MRSHSGQFVVTAVPFKGEKSRLISQFETNRNYIRLDPALLPVSCERIKQALSRQLGLKPAWTGRIFLSLYQASSGDDPVTITSAQFRDGWQYQLEMPDLLDRFRYVHAIVQVLLLETANRTAAVHSAEIPIWLSEGLAQALLLSEGVEIILPAPTSGPTGLRVATTVLSARLDNPLELTHQQLCASPALTFQQLSWPTAEQLDGEQAPGYRSSALFFVNELLWLDDGRACMGALLADLPQYYNWQFAFLHAFQRHFQRPLDVEKWWALHLEHFTGRDLRQTWPAEESWQKLDEVIRSAVQVRIGTNEMPLHTEVPLQTIIRDWDRQRQAQALQTKVREIEVVRLRLATNFVSLAEDYRRALLNYLQTRDRGGLPFGKKAARKLAADQALRQLDELDTRRLRLKPEPAAEFQANSPPGR